MRRPQPSPRPAVTAAVSLVLGLAAFGPAVASARMRRSHDAAAASSPRWTLQTFYTRPSTVAGEGVASYPDSSRLLFRGVGEVPAAVGALGFTHVGDEDIDASGDIYDDYEDDNPDPTSKLFTITAPDGQVSFYPHPLAPGEEFNNSFVTVSPDDRWMVSGEWNLEPRLLLFANPKGLASGTAIALAGEITLAPPLNHVQGCDFVNSTTLICDIDATADVHPVVEVDLSAPLHAGANAATTHRLFIPRQVSLCPGPEFESEGIDYNTSNGLLTLTMNQPGGCHTTSSVNVYRLTRGPSAPAIGVPLANGVQMVRRGHVPANRRVTFDAPVDATVGRRVTTTIVLARGRRTLASNRIPGHGRRRGENPTLTVARLTRGGGYSLTITSTGANRRTARSRLAFSAGSGLRG